MRLHDFAAVLLSIGASASTLAATPNFVTDEARQFATLSTDFRDELGMDESMLTGDLTFTLEPLPAELLAAMRSTEYPDSVALLIHGWSRNDLLLGETRSVDGFALLHDEFLVPGDGTFASLSINVVSSWEADSFYVTYSHDMLEWALLLNIEPSEEELVALTGVMTLTPVARFARLEEAIEFAQLEAASVSSLGTGDLGACNALDPEANPTLESPRKGETPEQFACRMRYYEGAANCCNTFREERAEARNRYLKRIGICAGIGGGIGILGGGIPGGIAGGVVAGHICQIAFAFGYEAELRLATSRFRMCMRGHQEKRIACDPTYDPCDDPDTSFLCYLPDCPCGP